MVSSVTYVYPHKIRWSFRGTCPTRDAAVSKHYSDASATSLPLGSLLGSIFTISFRISCYQKWFSPGASFQTSVPMVSAHLLLGALAISTLHSVDRRAADPDAGAATVTPRGGDRPYRSFDFFSVVYCLSFLFVLSSFSAAPI